MDRITEVLVNNEWKNIEFKNLAVGDIFRLWEIEGEVSLGEPLELKEVLYNGNAVWKCTSAPVPYINENGVDTLMVNCEPVE